jgi:hypothetical protein
MADRIRAAERNQRLFQRFSIGHSPRMADRHRDLADRTAPRHSEAAR